MQGFRRAAVHLALVALLLRAFLPAGWMPGGPGDAPLVMCSVAAMHDTADGKEIPAQHQADTPCAFAAMPALAAPETVAIFTPSLNVEYWRADVSVAAPSLAQPHTRPAPRAPPSLI
jgi:hypothetical protein